MTKNKCWPIHANFQSNFAKGVTFIVFSPRRAAGKSLGSIAFDRAIHFIGCLFYAVIKSHVQGVFGNLF